MRRFELIPVDGRKSFYGKCYVIEDGPEAILYSYDTKICTFNKDTGELIKTAFFGYSQTTKRHTKAFFNHYNIKG